MSDCILCNIASGELASRIIYQDDYALGVVDIRPRLAAGQCVVFPRKHVDSINDLQDEEALALFKAVRAVYNKISKLYKPKHVTIFMRGQTFPHIHVVLAPTPETYDDVFSQFLKLLTAYEPLARVSAAELDELAERLKEQ